MFDTSSLFIFTFDTGELSLKLASVGIITGNAVRVRDIGGVEVRLLSSAPFRLVSPFSPGLL